MNTQNAAESHERTALPYPDGCARGCCPTQAEHYRSVVLGKGDTSAEVADVKRRDAQLDKDRAAYKRLRHDGIQPHSVDGSAALESRAVEQIDIDFKVPIPKNERERVKDIVAENSMGKSTGEYAW